MNKSELIDVIARRSSVSKAAAGRMLDAFIKTVGDAIKDGESVVIPGFGKFTTVFLKEKKVRNPKTKELMSVPPHSLPVFRAGKRLKEMLK